MRKYKTFLWIQNDYFVEVTVFFVKKISCKRLKIVCVYLLNNFLRLQMKIAPKKKMKINKKTKQNNELQKYNYLKSTSLHYVRHLLVQCFKPNFSLRFCSVFYVILFYVYKKSTLIAPKNMLK